MIIIKSEREIGLMKIAGNIVYETHQVLKNYIKPGISTKQLDDIAYEFIISQGAIPSFKGYNDFPASICTSINDQVVHGVPNSYILKEGDIISIDIGACYQGYHGDSAWTYAVGVVSEDAKRLMQLTKEALYVGLEMAKPNNRIGDISNAIGEFATKHNLGVVQELSGHGIGKQLHEDPFVPNYGKKGVGALLKPGMVLAIEPMLNLGSAKIVILDDGQTIKTKDNSLSAHYEHTIAITEVGYEILTTKMEETNG